MAQTASLPADLVADLRVLQQKRDRFERCLTRAVSFGTFIGAAKDLLRATDIILIEQLPAETRASSETHHNG